MHQYQKQTTSWFFIALILSNHGIALAVRVEMDHQELQPGSLANRADAQEEFSTMSCEELGVAMSATMADVSARMDDRCNAESCSFNDSESEDIQSLAVLAMRITAIADVSDTKMCLPEVLEASTPFQTSQFTEKFLASAVSAEARNRFTLAFSEMTKVQEEIQALRGDVVDRRLLLPTNIEDPAVCPSPCVECSTQHNSWFKQDEVFSFKCILNAGDDKPEGRGISCAEPEQRRGWGNGHQFKTWCEVQDWQDLASQTLSISSKITCGAKAVMAPIQTGHAMSASLRETCESKESGEAVSQAALDELVELDNTVGDVVSAGNLAIFSVFMAVELTQAVGRLRTSTRGSSFISVDANGDSSSVEHSVHLSSNHSYTEGSWRCRRSILSLTRGLFGGMIQIIVGVAYLAIMGSFGLIAAATVWGADAVIAALGPYVGVAEGTTVATVSTEAANGAAAAIAANPVAQQAGAAAGTASVDAMAASAGTVATAEATEAAAAAGSAAVEGAAAEAILAAVGEGLAAITVLVEGFFPYVLGGAVGFAVLFGIWGFLKIWRSMNSPYDCSSGYVGHGSHAVCHPALRYGEGTHSQCPGTTGTENEIAFICARENRGIMTFMGNCHFFDE
jgi:hypothetical protein